METTAIGCVSNWEHVKNGIVDSALQQLGTVSLQTGVTWSNSGHRMG